jgi:hypothetical protein
MGAEEAEIMAHKVAQTVLHGPDTPSEIIFRFGKTLIPEDS